jgi:hypothetical protein
MKTKYTAILLNLLGGAVLCQAQTSEWATILRQTDVTTGVEYIAVVENTGSQLSVAPLGDQGSVFQLWGVKGASTLSAEGGSTTTGEYKNNNGHGNNIDGVDSSNPGNAPFVDSDPTVDDEKKTGSGSSGSTSGSGTTSTTTTLPEEHLLDTELVDVYQPAASLRIITEDPYPLASRTRADRPFAVQYTISGLLDSQLGVDAASKVLLNHDVKSYSKPIFVDGNFIQSDSFFSGYLSANGTSTISFSSSNLPNTDPLKGIGIEVFTIDALPDYQVPSTRLGTATLEVYPVTTGKIHGITHGGTYETMPTFNVELKDLYPTSTTYVQIYPGESNVGTVGTVLPDSVVVINDVTSQDKQVQISNWSSFVTEGGKWTMELVTETPFGIEVIEGIEWNFDNVIELNGQIFSSEK